MASWGTINLLHLNINWMDSGVLSASQLPQIWFSMPRLLNRPPTWRTDPCTCCSVPWRRSACPKVPTTPTPAPTAACSVSPPRSRTTDRQTSGHGRVTSPGSGTSVTGRTSRQRQLLCLCSGKCKCWVLYIVCKTPGVPHILVCK